MATPARTGSEEHVTFCRICEALCGLIATVEDGQVTQLRPDPDHVISQGFACPKGIAMVEVQNDPDRVRVPLRRKAGGAPGEFEEVSWDEALDDIGKRLKRIRDERGPHAIGYYLGNPASFSYSHFLWAVGFLHGLGSDQFYWAGTQDGANLFAASALLYGTTLHVPIPDILRTDHLLMLGANPFVSHGSALHVGRIRERLLEIPERGGTVVVVDPRRTETARHFDHVPIHPDSDVWLLAALLQVIFADGLEDRAYLAANATGVDVLKAMVAPHTPEAVSDRTGIEADRIRRMAREFATAETAVAYGRTGTCLGRYSTLVHTLLNSLNVVTGNLDRPGGAVFGTAPIPVDLLGRFAKLTSFGEKRSRSGGFADVLGCLPGTQLQYEIETAGATQIKALICGGGNPVNSIPGARGLARAIDEDLDLFVTLDMYVTESGQYADYVLPCATWLERDDPPLLVAMTWALEPYFQYADKVVDPPPGCREEWWVIEELSKRIGIVPSSLPPVRWLGKLGIKIPPKVMLDLVVRGWTQGDWFGLRRKGMSLKKMQRGADKHGRLFGEVPTGTLRKNLRTKDRKIHLGDATSAGELRRAVSEHVPRDPDFPLSLIGMRELRSHNSWMHNSPKLMAGRREHLLRVNPGDAAALAVADGDSVRVTSPWGTITTRAKVTDEMFPGTVALPGGWGHAGGWRVAVAAGGATYNDLMPVAPDQVEAVIGHAVLNGVGVRVEPTDPPGPAAPSVPQDIALTSPSQP
jgi:anaerobic selenocysteine-containing dehydrogenase